MILKIYFLALAIFITCDLLWLGVIAKNFYQTKLGYLLGPVVWPAAIIFYLLFIAGLVFFVILPNIQPGLIIRVVATGALFGLITYATYDLTNHATIKDWPISVTIIDMLWGAFLGAFVSGLTYYIYHTFLS